MISIMHCVLADTEKKCPFACCNGHSHNICIQIMAYSIVRQHHKHMHPIKVNYRHMTSAAADAGNRQRGFLVIVMTCIIKNHTFYATLYFNPRTVNRARTTQHYSRGI